MFITALTMLPCTLAISGYNIVDTWFVSQMQDWRDLAAMGYAFPVVMLFSFLFSGLATGIMVTVSQALGGNRYRKMSHLISAGLFYAIAVSVVCGLFGLLTIDLTFQLLGAGDDVLPKIRQYMIIWYIGGTPSAALAMAGNNILMGTGSTRMTSAMMLSGLVLNSILDPIFIFGKCGVPAMGIAGASLATVIAQSLSVITILSFLHFRYRYVTRSVLQWRLMKRTGLLILKFAAPAILGMLLIPLGNTIVTAILSQFGDEAVAAAATAGRLEIVAFVLPMSIGMGLMPMIGQNYGAHLYTRINQCRRIAMRAAFILLGVTGTLFAVYAEPLARIFTTDPVVLPLMTQYLRIIAPFFCLVEMHRFSTFFFTACGRPIAAALLNALRIFGFLVPFSAVALLAHWLTGVFWARATADLCAGLIAIYCARRLTRSFPADGLPDPVTSPGDTSDV